MTHSSGKNEQQATFELLDRYHPRASIADGERMMIDPGKVLDNVAQAMHRVDLDIDTEISIEDDVVSFDELASLIQNLSFGPSVAVHVVNTGVQIMAARYPAELVTRPFPPEYDLRKIYALQLSDEQHEAAKTIFNKRFTSTADLTDDDVAEDFEQLDDTGQLQVFVSLFFMYGSKISALKHRTGIE